MTTGGELVPAAISQSFEDKYGVPLGNMYGMTEVGVIGTDLYGEHRPAIRPAPGIDVRAVDGELHIRRRQSPYLGLSDPARWSDGWLRTRDAGVIDPETGLVSIKGRLDSQVSVGGMKVSPAKSVVSRPSWPSDWRRTNARASSASSVSCLAQPPGNSSAT